MLVLSVLVGSGQTCRDHSAKNVAVTNVNNVATPGSTGNMSNQNSNKDESKTDAEVVWGGRHVRLVITSRGGEIEFDCAHGEIKEPLKRDAQGRFDVAGTFVREGGPVRHDESGGRPARYSGKVEGDKMTLTVTLTDSNEKLDEFSLTRGSDGHLWKCK
jgi:hypothetical protein